MKSEDLHIFPGDTPATRPPFPLSDDSADFSLPAIPGMEAGTKKNKSAKKDRADEFRKTRKANRNGKHLERRFDHDKRSHKHIH